VAGARVVASAGTWAFTIALALYAYYEDGVAGVGVAVAVRVLPAALAAPYARRLAGRVSPRTLLAGSAAARGIGLAAVAAAVAADLPFAVVLALVSAFRVAGSADRWAFTARPGLDDLGFLGGALLAGCVATVAGLDVVFAVCALTLLVAAGIALLAPDATAYETPLAAPPVERPLHVLRGGRAAARAVVEVLVVVAALEVLGMGDGGVGWLSAAWAVGLLAGGRALGRSLAAASARAVCTGCALAGASLALLAVAPPSPVALVLLAVLGVGFALPQTEVDAEPMVDALARTLGATLAAALVLLFGDTAALLAAGVLVTAAGVAALALFEVAVEDEPGDRQLARPV
jgi:hypothetical protein